MIAQKLICEERAKLTCSHDGNVYFGRIVCLGFVTVFIHQSVAASRSNGRHDIDGGDNKEYLKAHEQVEYKRYCNGNKRAQNVRRHHFEIRERAGVTPYAPVNTGDNSCGKRDSKQYKHI
jgi:hypothetical protein